MKLILQDQSTIAWHIAFFVDTTTPGMVSRRCEITFSHNHLILVGLLVSLCTVIEIIASLLASALETTGGASISCGKLRMACDTLSRTSLRLLQDLSRLNSTVMELLPWELEDVIFLIPSMELIAFKWFCDLGFNNILIGTRIIL
jgi:hypothetical protein